VSAALKSIVVIGNLDGIHRGHQAVLRQARALADRSSARLVVLTFDPHPAEVLHQKVKPRLCTVERRVELLRANGADEVVVEPFTLELAALTPEAFARDLLSARLHCSAVVVGENFRFGAHRAGDKSTLHELGRQMGFEVVAAEIASDEKGPFSSTRVRNAIAAGDLAEATRVLGRPHSISGVVEHGDERGRTIGFPTANLGGVTEMLPPYGVYAVRAETGSNQRVLRPGVMNLGVRPTVDGTKLRIEVHLFDFDGDLYEQPMRVHLIERVREERKFAGLGELKAQIAKDADTARAILRG
jgi:riboflavin kinase/FMN adenylyltransferase